MAFMNPNMIRYFIISPAQRYGLRVYNEYFHLFASWRASEDLRAVDPRVICVRRPTLALRDARRADYENDDSKFVNRVI
jgi:hypothetical protein